ncbi:MULTISPECIES: hypothetical protein [Leptolyngbya]|uniref:hypothetical protein n=1 Tax=Leptolyngbya TaxID=47251 RepID=UPI001687CDDF|nr:hypothetical protein [Leptolyngbya sp. FACHB-1624]MBD1855232.1 hypothetical protein [Leptolyngbya sp. FACHB-1624]
MEICAIAARLSIASHPSGTLTAAVLYYLMLSIYEQTKQGRGTRSRILAILNETDGLTRNELVKRSRLTYEQVRRQTRNLHIAGVIESRLVEGERRYYLKKPSASPVLVGFLLLAWLPILYSTIEVEPIKISPYDQRDS